MPNFKHPAFVKVDDAQQRKELIEWLEMIGYSEFKPISRFDRDTIATDTHFADKTPIENSDYFIWTNDMCDRELRNTHIDCGTNIALFKAIAAINGENDYMQWFTDIRGDYYECKYHILPERLRLANYIKATPTELITLKPNDMTQIKSEKAKEFVDDKTITQDQIPFLVLHPQHAFKAIIIAETELSEAHAKELQELQSDIDRYKTDLDEAKQREAINDRILADKRKEIELLETQLQNVRIQALSFYCRCCSLGDMCTDLGDDTDKFYEHWRDFALKLNK